MGRTVNPTMRAEFLSHGPGRLLPMTTPDPSPSLDRPANVAALAAQLDSTLEFYFDRMEGLADEEYQARRATLIEQHTMSESDGLFVRVRRGEHPTTSKFSEAPYPSDIKLLRSSGKFLQKC